MRYTTIIDLRDWPPLYANKNIRLVYLHLCLVSGYHDYNRDIAAISLRRLEAETGLTISAVRNALKALEKYKLVQRKKDRILVRKWLKEQEITPRTQKKKSVIIDEHEIRIVKPEKTPRQQLEEAAAQGDKRAQEILTKHFK